MKRGKGRGTLWERAGAVRTAPRAGASTFFAGGRCCWLWFGCCWWVAGTPAMRDRKRKIWHAWRCNSQQCCNGLGDVLLILMYGRPTDHQSVCVSDVTVSTRCLTTKFNTRPKGDHVQQGKAPPGTKLAAPALSIRSGGCVGPSCWATPVGPPRESEESNLCAVIWVSDINWVRGSRRWHPIA